MMKVATILAAAVSAVQALNWTIIAEDVGTIATGVAFSTATHGYLPADENGEGAEILVSDDGGKTWNYIAPKAGGFLFLDVAAYGQSAVVSGVFGEEFSDDDGKHFNASLGGGQGQCVRTIGPRGQEVGYGVAGEFGLISSKNGVAVSYDGGITFTAYDAKLFTDARYAAFLSKTEWYVSAGQWPESADDDQASNDDPFSNDNTFETPKPSFIPITRRFGLKRDEKTDKMRPYVTPLSELSNSTVFEAQVSVTQDGGKTFTSVFEDHANFYANGIACESSQSCCFVGEADAGPEPGARIHCTTDGGSNWNRTLWLSGAQNSLLDITTTGTSGEYWAVGGTLGALSATGTFYHSTDSGASWTLVSTIDGHYGTAVDCVDSTHCWAAVVEVLTQESAVAGLVA